MITEGSGLEAPQGRAGIRLVRGAPVKRKESRTVQRSESELWRQVSSPASLRQMNCSKMYHKTGQLASAFQGRYAG